MPSDICPHCGQPTDDKDGKCYNPECQSVDKTTTFAGLKIPTHGWGQTIKLVLIMAFVAAVVLTFIPINPKEEEEPEGETGIEGELQHAASPVYEKPITLREGSVEAPIETTPEPEPPGGLDWDTLKYPGAQQKFNYLGNQVGDDERAYVTTDSYENVKQFYVDLIEDYFFKVQSSEVINGDSAKLTLLNDTGSLTVWMTKYSWDENVHIKVSSLENLTDERLKSFGGPPPEEEKTE